MSPDELEGGLADGARRGSLRIVGAPRVNVLTRFETEPPGALVKFDGITLCDATPCAKRVPTGAHVVVFEKAHHAPARVSVVLGTGETVAARLSLSSAMLRLQADVPGVAVSVNGQTGRTPSLFQVAAGRVEVVVTDPCFARVGDTLELAAGEDRVLRISASRRVAELEVNAEDHRRNAVEAVVVVDGLEVGTAGERLKVPLCSSVVKVKLGVQEWSQALQLVEGQVTKLTARPQQATLVRSPLDPLEVTVAEYAACVKENLCTPPEKGTDCNWHVADLELHPVNCVTWAQSDTYCRAAGKRLPTSDEWEWAASNGGRTEYPWGDAAPDQRRARWKTSEGTARVGSSRAGGTPTGVYDLAGNVWEWTSTSSESGREIRGGSWKNKQPAVLRAQSRSWSDPEAASPDIGFRCVKP